MAQSNLVQLAQTGDADAIAMLMNASLQTIGIQARAVTQTGDLHVLLEAERSLPPTSCVEFIRQGIAQLGIACLSSAVIYCRELGQSTPAWVQQIDLSTLPLLPNPFVLSPEAKLEIDDGFWFKPPEFFGAGRGQLFDLMVLLSLPLCFILNSAYLWNRYLVTDRVNPQVTERLAASGAAISADPFSAGYQHATAALKLTQAEKMETNQAWQKISEEWKQATALMQAVPPSHPKHELAQRKMQEYQRYADYVASLVGMQLKKVISAETAPKSIIAGKNLFFAPNASSDHAITIYDREFNLVRTLSNQIDLAAFGYSQFQGTQQGAPLEGAASPDGQAVWVSNYQMSGQGFTTTADDACLPTSNYESSFLYRLSTETLSIDRVVQVGAVPKSVTVSPNSRYVLVSNWCSWDVSVIDTQTHKEIRRVQVGPYPRGIAIDANSAKAYVAIFGGDDIATIDLNDFSVTWLTNIGRAPAHLTLDPTGQYLYASFSGAGQVAKIDLTTQTIVAQAATGNTPRSMAMSSNGQFLYVVNYNSDTVSKVRTQDMQIVQTMNVNPSPIGITYDPQTRQVWVACQSGSILVFQD